MWAATDRRRIGWIRSYLREGVVHHDYRDHAALLPEGPAKDLLPQFYAKYELARAAALEDLRQAWTPPPVDDAAREGHLRWMALRDRRTCAKADSALGDRGRLRGVSGTRQDHAVVGSRSREALFTQLECL